MYSSTGRSNEGGTEVVFAQIADGLRKHGHRVVRAFAEPSSPPSDSEEVISLTDLSFIGYKATLSKVPAILSSLWRLSRGLYRIRPNVVNVHFVRAEALYFLVLRWVFGYRLILSFHGSDALLPKGHHRTIVPKIAVRADAVTAVSEGVSEAIQELSSPAPVRVTVIPNGVPLKFWGASESERLEKDCSRFRIVTVGRLVKVKGYDLLIRAFSVLQKHVPEASLTIVGDGPERDKLAALVELNGLTDLVTFAGRQTPAEVRTHLRSSSVFVLPSRSEGLPLALLEAMACALPAVATRVGGVPEVLIPEAGTIVSPEDPDALAHALAELARDRDRVEAMGKAARRHALTYSSDRVVHAFDELFRDLSRE